MPCHLIVVMPLKCERHPCLQKARPIKGELAQIVQADRTEQPLNWYRAPAKRAADAEVPSSAAKESLGSAAVPVACA